MVIQAIYAIFILIVPAIIQMACKKWKLLQKVGPLILCYALGFLFSLFKPVGDEFIKSIAEASIVIAVPLFLFTANISKLIKDAPRMFIAFLLMVASVFVASTASTYFFQDLTFIADLSASVAGIFTGGTLNFSALAITFNIPANLFVVINTVDMIAGAIYFLVLLQWGRSLMADAKAEEASFPKTGLSVKNFVISILLAIFVVALSAGVSFLTLSKLDLRVLFVALTVIGLAVSRLKFFEKTNAPYFAGDYLILVFCFGLSQLINFKTIGDYGVEILGYTCLTLIFIVMVFGVLCKIFKIDKETATLTHIAGIYGAPFIIVYSNYLKKPRLILPGIALALLGYTIGTIFGIMMRDFLVSFFQL